MAKTTFTAAGDAFITRRLPRGGYEGFEELSRFIKSHDVAFLNLESTFHDGEGIPAAVSGGTWAMSDPRTLDDMKEYGFNLFNTANNHSCDYSQSGVLATIRHLKARDMVFSGTGKDLNNASRPCYLEVRGTRVALISCCSTFDPSAKAGGQGVDMIGRPGLNPLGFQKYFHVDQAHFDMAKALASATKINAKEERKVRNGYAVPPPEGTFSLGEASFILDDHCWIESVPKKQDMARIEAEIKEARNQADVVLVSFHGHETDTEITNVPPMFLETFSRNCIDAGADVVIGHGPHELQGIECYKNGVIFYSIGNYIFETENVSCQPWDAFANKGYPQDMKVGEYMDKRSKNGTQGFCVKPEIWNAVMPSWTMEDGRITEVQLHPISLGQELPRSQKGRPMLSHDEKWLEYLADLSKPYGTTIEIKDGVGYIKF